jgi:hypothetical protein
MRSCIAGLLAFASFVTAAPPLPHSKPFAQAYSKRQANGTSGGTLQVDLGYEVYEGFHNSTSDINYWKGIRYAAPPLGELRWQAPHPPTINRSEVISAKEYGPICPQSLPGGDPGVFGDEDCLVLNVWAPPNADGFPVLVWIHGGKEEFRYLCSVPI